MAEPRDLLSELSAATEIKSPSSDKVQSWNFGDDEETEESGSEEAANDTPAVAKQKGKLSEAEILSSAKASTAMVELCTSLLSETLIQVRYQRKIKSEDRERLEEKILDSLDKNLTEEERFLKAKYERLEKKKKEKMANIKVSDRSRQSMVEAFALYSETTGKTFMSPAGTLAVTVIESVIKSVAEALLD